MRFSPKESTYCHLVGGGDYPVCRITRSRHRGKRLMSRLQSFVPPFPKR
jgi:hypothetical protein